MKAAAFAVLTACGLVDSEAAELPAATTAHGATTATHALALHVQKRREAAMASGEKNLAAGAADAAASAFDAAVAMAHAPDAEIGLVRSYMQAGHYRQALSASAHTAGAHSEEPEGAALYVRLLHAGGQTAAARRILLEAQARTQADPALARAARWMQSGPAMASGGGDIANTFAPYSLPPLPLASAAVAGSAVLIDGGRHALAPLESLASMSRAGSIWLRNGLGATSKATVAGTYRLARLALLRLEQPLPLPASSMFAGSAPFPGSVAYAAEYSTARNAQPEWPLLRYGFLGTAVHDGQDRKLGIALPDGAHGGPVFDAAGALTGLALPGTQGEAVLLPASRIRALLGERLGPVAPPKNGPRLAIEDIYETAMLMTLQVLTAR